MKYIIGSVGVFSFFKYLQLLELLWYNDNQKIIKELSLLLSQARIMEEELNY